jgi:hypothetical protein
MQLQSCNSSATAAALSPFHLLLCCCTANSTLALPPLQPHVAALLLLLLRRLPAHLSCVQTTKNPHNASCRQTPMQTSRRLRSAHRYTTQQSPTLQTPSSKNPAARSLLLLLLQLSHQATNHIRLPSLAAKTGQPLCLL